MQREHAIGTVMGMAVGDALGTTYEFERIDQPELPALATGPAHDVVGGGPFGLVAGQITDDTQLAICLARSLAERRRLDVDDLAQRYVVWSEHAFDIGTQTRGAIQLLAGQFEPAQPPDRAGVRVWHLTGRRAAGNGSLMRTAPIGVAFAGDEARVIDAAIADSAITHGDPRCVLACAAFDAAIARAIRAPATGAQMVETARDALAIAAARARDLWPVFPDAAHAHADDVVHIERAAGELARDLDDALADRLVQSVEPLHLQRNMGFVRVAFRLAFWHAVHTPSWRDALVDVASRGGDADTNAAIAGALLGARDGIGAIPAAWVERVLAVTQPGPRAWADAHHPRHLLAVCERPLC